MVHEHSQGINEPKLSARPSERVSVSEGFVKIGHLKDFPAGSMKKANLGDEELLVANIEGSIYAITDTCTHRGCSLSDGTMEDGEVICPCHGGRYDLRTGKVVAPPPMRDETSYAVRVDGSDVFVKKS